MNAVILYLAMLRLTSVRAWKSPYQKSKFWAISALSVTAGADWYTDTG